jgi:hypothetical protein
LQNATEPLELGSHRFCQSPVTFRNYTEAFLAAELSVQKGGKSEIRS